MGLLNVLGVSINVFTETYTVDINFIGKFIGILCGWVGVGFGIILFSLVLKFITLPFDVMQRITMRKQNIQMKENQARMEKLQKQYANDKEMYNQKVMEMYKENGMSMFSSCLPMILSMVIFFIAIGAFNSYSAYANVENYNQLVSAYNSAIVREVASLKDDNYSLTKAEEIKNEEGEVVGYYVTYKVEDTALGGKPLYYEAIYKEENAEFVEYNAENPAASKHNIIADDIKAFLQAENTKKSYFVNVDKIVAEKDGAYKSVYEAIEKIKTDLMAAKPDTAEQDLWNSAYRSYYEGIAQDAVVSAYNGTGEYVGKSVVSNTKFLWIKNVWVTDAMYKNPVLEYKDFETAIATKSGCSCSTTNKAAQIDAYKQDGYNKVTAKLDKQKNQYNGYFVLIALSIGTILLQQFVTMRTQKEQQKYSSVDGQGAGQQKMMMVVMTGMFAIFSFMYSSAFSIYLIVSNLFSLGSTLIINKVVDRVAENKEAKKAEAKFNSRYGGRVAAAREAGKQAAKENKNKKSANSQDEKKKK
jgi:membrane protein insertase Oxa1/YidC/SpoIIIJ